MDTWTSVLLLIGATIGVQVALWARIDRPLWYDELWRPHFAGEPWRTFWSELSAANTPSSVGSLSLTRLTGDVLGWHAWSLRLIGAGVWLPVLAAVSFLLARRFTGSGPALVTAVTIALAGTVVDTGTQLKPYVLEAAVTVAVVVLWMRPHSLWRRTAAGMLALLSLPAVFLLVPLAAADVARALPHRVGWPATGRAIGRVVPALAVAATHLALFVAHQSSQRASHFWDDHFLAGRGLVGGLRFTAGQIGAILGGAPPGIDRYDPNLVHGLSEGHRVTTTLLGLATTIAMVLGARMLLRSAEGTTLLVALGGAELLQLAASAGRYWPFGACRTNLFLVPLLTVLVGAGAGEVIRILRGAAARSVWPGAITGLAVLVGLAAMPVCAVGGTVTLWHDRHEPRAIEGMAEATIAARDQYRPGDLVVVGGRLARAGWLYGMELSDDVPARDRPVRPRVPRPATVFLTTIGHGGAVRAIRLRARPPRRVLLFLLAYDYRDAPAELASLHHIGWCDQVVRSFPLTGSLHSLGRCGLSS